MLAGGLDFEHFGGEFFGRPRRLFLLLGPAACRRGRRGAGGRGAADVFLDEVDLGDGDVEGGLAGES